MPVRRHLSWLEIGGVTVVVGLVGAFFIPVVAQGKSNAQRSKCLSNMKQIGAALMMYAEDHDQTLPVTTELKPREGLGAHWSYLIQPYVQSEKMFVCPADTDPAYAYVDEGSARKRVPLLSYINNYAAIPAHDFYPVPRYALTAPDSLILITERRSSTPNGVKLPSWKGTSGFEPGQPCRERKLGTGYRRVRFDEAQRVLDEAKTDRDLLIIRVKWDAHDNGSNYVFADGHARWTGLAATLDPTHFLWGERFYPRSEPNATECDQQPTTYFNPAKGNHP